jgi:hypothetical protein
VVLQEAILNTTSKVTYILSVSDNNGNTLYYKTMTCPYGSGYGPVTYINQVEGIIVGPAGGYHTTFKPLSSTIFFGYIDLVSNYNHLSSSNLTSQSGESSNLYQHVTSNYGETYGSGYLYTVQSTEVTRTAT